MEQTAWYTFYKEVFDQKTMNMLVEQMGNPMHKAIRINTKRISIEDFIKKSHEYKWNLTSIPWCEEGFWIDREDTSTALGNHIMHYSGLFYVQEASSMLPVSLFDWNEEGGKLILDMASAPGSKTTQIESLTTYKSLIVGNELATSRLKAMTTNLERLGTQRVVVTKKNANIFGELFPNTFDKILLDAPCSGDGMIRKNTKIAQKWTEKESLSMAKLQKQLIISAFESLKPGGEMVYSTCTLSPYENENVVQHLIDSYGEALEIDNHSQLSGNMLKHFDNRIYDESIKNGIRIFPWQFGSEAFFAIKIIKIAPTSGKKTVIPKTRREVEILERKKEKIIISYIKKHFGVDFAINKRSILIERKNTIWMAPRRFFTECDVIKSLWHGMKLGDLYHHTFKISHSFALEYGAEARFHVYEMTDDELLMIMKGKDIVCDQEFENSSILILRKDGLVIGTGKYIKGKIKNTLPRSIILNHSNLVF